MKHAHALSQRLLAETLGTALLLCVVVGSGIMAQRLSGGQEAVALLANALATVGGLYVLIELLGPVSGAHFNPAVTGVLALQGAHPRREWLPYALAQSLGSVLGVWVAHAMFELPVWQFSTHVRSGSGLWIAETVATAGLLLVVLRAPAGKASACVAGYIGAAYWFTASTSFANPVAALGRSFTDTYAGIAPGSAPAFVLAQVAGALLGWGLHRALGQAKPQA